MDGLVRPSLDDLGLPIHLALAPGVQLSLHRAPRRRDFQQLACCWRGAWRPHDAFRVECGLVAVQLALPHHPCCPRAMGQRPLQGAFASTNSP